MIKKRHILVLTLVFCLAVSFIVASVGYDPWVDLDDDGYIGPSDFAIFAGQYGTSGTPINKTAKLLELEARIDSLNLTLLTEYYDITDCHVVFVDASGDLITGYLDVDSGTLYVDDVNDRVGIGNTNPLHKLEVGNLGELYNYLRVRSSDFGGIMFYDGEGANSGAIIYNHVDDALRFMTRPPVGSPTDKMRITSDGDVGIGTAIPTSKLDVAGDIQGETLKGNQIRLGSTDGNHIIYFYDSFQTGEYISWYDAGDQFYVSDDIDIDGSLSAGAITIPTTTRYYSVPGAAWQPRNNDIDFTSFGTDFYTSTPGSVSFWAPVNLPHGAVVTELRAWTRDNNVSSDMHVYLWRQVVDLADEMAHVSSSGASSSYLPCADSSIDYSTVDNQNYAYFVMGTVRSGNSNHRLTKVRITYTITETLP